MILILLLIFLVNEPNRPDLLYDLGVASCKNKEFEQAAAYFKSASSVDECSEKLKEQSLFNLGNACVELNQLSDAVVHYERVLELNDQNEHAKHNLQIVKKMLEEQKKQEQNEQNKDNKEKKQDQKEDSSDKAQDEKDQQKNQKNDLKISNQSNSLSQKNLQIKKMNKAPAVNLIEKKMKKNLQRKVRQILK